MLYGEHTVPENLEHGEYIVDNISYFDKLDEMRYIVQVTEWYTDIDNPLATNFGGVYSAGRCIYM